MAVLGKPGVDGLSQALGVLREQYAAAAALQDLGCAIVCTPSFNVGAVATYKSAGFQQLPEIRDQYGDANSTARRRGQHDER